MGRRKPGRRLARLLSLSRGTKRTLMVVSDVAMIPLALWSSLVLKSGDLLPPFAFLWPLILTTIVVSIGTFAWLGLYRAVIRYIAAKAVTAVAIGVTLAVVAVVVVDRLFGKPDIPVTALVIFWILAFLYVAGTRFVVRALFLSSIGLRGAERVIIYGAGNAGVQLCQLLAAGGEVLPVAFIDDNVALQGSIIGGLEVFDRAYIPSLVEDYGVKRVLLALPSVPRHRRKQILDTLEPLALRVQTVPDVTSLVSERVRFEAVRDVDAVDLLGRDPVPPNRALLDACIRGKCVMVTGAGGSIGSELCRQIIREQPRQLILLEMSEIALYAIERELREICAVERLEGQIVGLLGNAHHQYRVREILQTYHVQTIYHAAAYKHVPIVEQNIVEGVHNNVFSTWHMAEAALACSVEAFVLVSTDKAVNPTNVMGATKRMAEIVLQGVQELSTSTRFCMVRFGNVLESSGSVVPLFREQISRGGPVTVTHAEVIRYFMTIPEAAQLVIQASSMAKGGDVFVLDMGKAIKIDDLARRMIQLSGYTVRDDDNPDGDIEIQYTGLRPAEKLYEELLIGKAVTGTEHPMIMRATEHALPWSTVRRLLEDLMTATRRFDCPAVRQILKEAVREYQPVDDIQDYVWRRRLAQNPPVSSTKVADISQRRPR